MVCFAVVGSMGTLLTAVALFTPASMSAALYYVIHSTLAAAALFLIADLVRRRRPNQADTLIVAPQFDQLGLIGSLFFVGAIAMVGVPPLSGFIGKLLILDSARDAVQAGWIWSLLLISSLVGMVGFARGGSTLFWKSCSVEGRCTPSPVARPVLPIVAVCLLLLGTAMLTAYAGPVTAYLDQTAAQLFAPSGYIDAVLGAEGGNE
jgi:multicomponent K+:H+ antiporter subunit D